MKNQLVSFARNQAVFNWLSVSEAGGQFVAPIMSAPLVLWALYIPRRYGMGNAAPVDKQVPQTSQPDGNLLAQQVHPGRVLE